MFSVSSASSARCRTWLSPLAIDPRRPLAQVVDQLRRLGLGQVLVHLFARVSRQRVEVRTLRRGHRLVAGLPVVGIFLQSSRVVIGVSLIAHARKKSKTAASGDG